MSSDPTSGPPDPPEPPAGSTRLGDGRVFTTEELAPLLYEDLRRLAASYMGRESPGATLQPTALVNEACLRLLGQDKQEWESRAHFLAIAATAMRRVLVDAARERGRQKRGGGWDRVTLGAAGDADARSLSLIDLDAALEKLARVGERLVRVVELRWFAGLTLEEIAEVLDTSRTSIVRDWAKARAYLETWLAGPA